MLQLSPRIKRITLVVGGVIAIGIAGFTIFIDWKLRRAVPDYSGHEVMPALTASVSVVHDEYGVPHIFAENMNDAARALGYIHASERLFQMEMNRRAGQGRLSEAVGSEMLGVDKFIRTLGLYPLAESSYAAMSPEAQTFFQAYADGVNQWLNTHKNKLPAEFMLLGITPEPWKPADSVVWGKLMALQLSSNYKLEMLRARLQKLTPQQMVALFPPPDGDVPITIDPHSVLPISISTSAPAPVGTRVPSGVPMPQAPLQQPAVQPIPAPTLAPVPAPGLKNHTSLEEDSTLAALDQLGQITSLAHAASNEWVISGARTESGKPILANDPHLELEAPILWYLARIVTPGFSIKGATVPGLPIFLLGQNDHIAWGFTTTGSDVQDLFTEIVDTKDPSQYMTREGPQPFIAREEIIHVKGGRDVKLIVRSTRHGPVMSDIDADMAAIAGKGNVMALQFTGLEANDTTSEALMRLNRSTDWESFRSALRLYQAPPQNVVYADTAGNIGYINPGLVPVRRKGLGLVPSDGAFGDYDWRGTVPFDQLPQRYNPPAGFIFNANNLLVDPGFFYYMGKDWEEPYRAERLQYFFDTLQKHSLDTSAMMQADHVSRAAHDLLPHLLRQHPSDARSVEAIALLQKWDGTMDKDRPEPLIFDAWLHEMRQLTLADKSNDALKERNPFMASSVYAILAGDKNEWCGKSLDKPAGNCDAITQQALSNALEMLTKRDGSNMQKWRWGNEHVTELKHKVFSHVPVLSGMTNLSVPSSGDFYTLDRGGDFELTGDKPFGRRHGGGFRGIYDLSNPDASRFMITTGESGHIFSKHYSDLLPLWNDVKSFTLAGSKAELLAKGDPEFTFEPVK